MEKATDLNKNSQQPSFFKKIRWTFGILTFLMFGLFWAVIYIAEDQLEIISLHHWLDTEANQYIKKYAQLGDDTPLPNEDEFSTYWSEREHPLWLNNYKKAGLYEQLLGTEDKHFIVTPHPSGEGLLYILFQDDADDYLDEYEANLHTLTLFLGTFSTILMILYGIYFVRSISVPLRHIQHKVDLMSPEHPDFTIDTKYQETQEIERSLLKSKHHIAQFFTREKEFSRFASHELRTPIMVIQGSADLLAKVPNQPNVALKAINRLHQASEEMTLLTETFLLLGKQDIEAHHFHHYKIEEILKTQINHLQPLFAKQEMGAQLSIIEGEPCLAPSSFITVVINNLIKNAFSYSVGDIQIELNNNQLCITNCHDGNDTYNAGYGCGLVIVERICERMNWAFTIEQTEKDFITTVNFTSFQMT
ncbi:sensor histidine kinase [Aliivibrio fischeri]|uniref:sensor histidine kinase n=1 Tax=Aliivibrio fischeri TaxID=668 RepID=UPI0007C4E957|nr:HAMP domain-containing sensor histidine kinase [Aliivibrio fischeri]